MLTHVMNICDKFH